MTFDEGALFSPTTITVIGASDRVAASRSLLRNLLEPTDDAFSGRLQLVNKSGRTVAGRQPLTSPAELTGEPGVVVLMIPPSACVPALEQLPSRPDGVVVYSGGSEAGHADAERDVREWARTSGVPLIGMQSTGFVRPADHVRAVVAPLRRPPAPGPIALVMQSAGLLGGTMNAFTARGLGLDTAVSLGNGTALSAARIGRALLTRPDVRCLALYVDALDDIDEFLACASDAQRLGKPIFLCLGGSSPIGAQLVLSHTGQLATDQRVVDGLARQFDVTIVPSIDDLVWSVDAAAETGFVRPGPGAVGVMGTSGGACGIVADALSLAGIALPPPSVEVLTATGRPALNPLDLGAASLDSPTALDAAIDTFVADPGYSILVSIAAPGLPPKGSGETQRVQMGSFVRSVTAAGKTPAFVSPVAAYGRDQAWELEAWPGVVVADGTREAAAKVRALWRWANASGYEAGEAAWAARPATSDRVLTGPAVRDMLAEVGLGWPDEVWVADPTELTPIAADLAYPTVAKAEAGLAHRVAEGGVITRLADPEAAQAAYALLHRRFGGSISFSAYIDHGAEFVLGFQQDRRYGPLLMFGLGGTGVGDAVAFRRAPATDRQLVGLIAEFVDDRDHRLVLAKTAQAFQRCIASLPHVVSIDLNPLTVVDGIVVCLDGKVHLEGANP